MSFSKKVKEELVRQISSARHCQMAELSALLHFIGQFGEDKEGNLVLGFRTENEFVLRKCFTLLKKTFNIENSVMLSHEESLKIINKFGDFSKPVSSLFIKNTCCQRAFLRGAFLSVGSISDPEKGYHLEFVCDYEKQAEQLQQIMQDFGIEAKIVIRKKYHVVYIKEGSGIVELLALMEAHVALMDFENMRIVKDMRNSINRRVNCEAANITKTVNAASKQVEDILLIQRKIGFGQLADSLREIAELRLDNPDATLKELGELLNPPVGKSGVNHRLRKLSELAETVRNKEEDYYDDKNSYN